jgi:hypothetical protein
VTNQRKGAVSKTTQPVEKVFVGPVGASKEARNKTETLQKRRFQLLNQRLKRALRACLVKVKVEPADVLGYAADLSQ